MKKNLSNREEKKKRTEQNFRELGITEEQQKCLEKNLLYRMIMLFD